MKRGGLEVAFLSGTTHHILRTQIGSAGWSTRNAAYFTKLVAKSILKTKGTTSWSRKSSTLLPRRHSGQIRACCDTSRCKQWVTYPSRLLCRRCRLFLLLLLPFKLKRCPFVIAWNYHPQWKSRRRKRRGLLCTTCRPSGPPTRLFPSSSGHSIGQYFTHETRNFGSRHSAGG